MANKRSKAREQAAQALYQWQMTGQDLGDIDTQFLEENDLKRFDVPYFQKLLHGVPSHLGDIDERLKAHLDRTVESVDPVERAILRLATYEMIFQPDVPYRVVINEAVELAKVFGSEQGHRYVNGVLDRVAQDTRGLEVKAKRG